MGSRMAVAAIVLLGGALQATLWQTGLFALSADESGRTLEAHAWLHGTMDPRTPWLPLHRVVHGSALALFPDLFWTPRIVTCVLGLVVVLAVMRLAAQLFEDRRVTCLAGILAVFFPPRAALASVPLSEMLLAACLLPAAACFAGCMRGAAGTRVASLVAGCLFVAFGESVRYEGWIVGLMTSVTLLLGLRAGRIPPGAAAAGIVLVASVPVAWIAQSVLAGHPLHFFRSTVNRFVEVHGAGALTLWQCGLPWQLAKQSVMTLNALGLVALREQCRTDPALRRATAIVAASLGLTAFVTMITRGLPTDVFWRQAFVWSLPLLPFTARALLDLPRWIGLAPDVAPRVTALTLAGLLAVHAFQIDRLARRNTFDPDDRAMGDWLRVHVEATGPDTCGVTVVTPGWSSLDVRIASNHPAVFDRERQTCQHLLVENPQGATVPPPGTTLEVRIGKWSLFRSQ